MKIIKYILIGFSIFFLIILIIGITLILIDLYQMRVCFNANGFFYFLNKFTPLKELFTVTVALPSVYFILYQIENLAVSNNRTKEILENEIKSKTLEISNLFYVNIQPLIRRFTKVLKARNKYLLKQSWFFDEFTYQSLNEQNKKWQKEYSELQSGIKDIVIDTLNNIESVSKIISNGNIDKKLAFNLFGKLFIKQVETLYPFIAEYRRSNNNEDNYSDTVKLYKDWKSLV